MSVCSSCGANFAPQNAGQRICDACAALAVTPPAGTKKIGSYLLAHELGAGRFSTSWLAESESGGGVILKLLRAYAPEPSTVQRYLDEVKRIGSRRMLEHPALARVLDAGVHLGGALFLIYESGGELTLADELRSRGRIVATRALELCAQLCEGLHAMHRAELFHFDLKPANVGVIRDESSGSEQAVLLDGATGHLLLHAGLRETGLLPISTVAYLAPELARGEHADGRADLYAVAVLLYQLLTGRLPLTGHTAEQLLESHKTQKPLRLRDVGRRVHGDLEALLARALAKNPAERFRDGNEMAAALRKVAPVADQATDDTSAEDELEDPLPIGGGPAEPPEPEVYAPPKPKPLPVAAAPAAIAQAPIAAPQTETPAHADGPDTTPPAAFDPSQARPFNQTAEAEVAPPPASVQRATVDTPRAKLPPRMAPLLAARPRPKKLTPLWIAVAASVVIAVIAIALALRPEPAAQPKHRKAAPSADASEIAEGSNPAAQAAGTPPPIAAAPTPAPVAASAPAPAAPAPAPVHAAAPPPAAPVPSEAPVAGTPEPAPAKPAPKKVAAAPVSGAKSDLAEAQRQLARHQAKPAMRSLFTLLDRTDAAPADRAQATKLMAEAEAEVGNKEAAIDWYRKYLRLTDDAGERAKVIKQIQALSH